MNAAFFYYFALITLQTSKSITVLTYALTCLPALITIYSRLYRSQKPTFVKLIVKRAIRNEKEELRKFQPRSDLLVSKFTLPRLLVEVNSKPKTDCPEDLVRMLLTGAAVVRFANRHLNGFMADKNFVLIAIYIWDNGEVYCYSLFQVPNNPEVCLTLYTIKLTSWVILGSLQWNQLLIGHLGWPRQVCTSIVQSSPHVGKGRERWRHESENDSVTKQDWETWRRIPYELV